jgi:hypothetical protein
MPFNNSILWTTLPAAADVERWAAEVATLIHYKSM